MQLSIIFALLGWIAVVNAGGLSQLFLTASNRPSSNENYEQPSSKQVSHIKQCKTVETTSLEPNEVLQSTISPEVSSTRKTVPLPTLAPSSSLTSTEINTDIDSISRKSERRVVPLPTLKPTSTLSPIQVGSDYGQRNVPHSGIMGLIPLATRALELIKERVDESVPNPQKLLPQPTLKPSSTLTTTEVSLEREDQIQDDCETLPDGIGSRLDAKTLKTLVKNQLG
uniref:Uncharacterized protein n=1 Tax=Drosophila melanogaster TaxID=7227 RepID=A0A0B4K7N7_DROME|nr:uncharacterized protein Dmel_CG43092 [Drosophila melanogaster]AFH06565.1 uncharacterized protein Dmel_CG43092 [Drosophila melanogaster]|eukprot:NP_001247247.1 uncharacterized protein Dmel_CG43092 [Drosophila melanogaster]